MVDVETMSMSSDGPTTSVFASDDLMTSPTVGKFDIKSFVQQHKVYLGVGCVVVGMIVWYMFVYNKNKSPDKPKLKDTILPVPVPGEAPAPQPVHINEIKKRRHRSSSGNVKD